MKKRGHDLSDEARALRDEGDLVAAGNHYTAAAHEYAGTVTEHTFPGVDGTRSAVSVLCSAATCFRIAGEQSRMRNRAQMGILLAEDYTTYINEQSFESGSFAALRRGAWPEFIGNLRVVAGADDADAAYDRAADIYAEFGDWAFAYGEKEHIRLAAFFRSLRHGLGEEIPEDAPEQQGLETTFTEWLDSKRARMPDLLDRLDEQGRWPLQ